MILKYRISLTLRFVIAIAISCFLITLNGTKLSATSGDKERQEECCPFDQVDYTQQDGLWNPRDVIAGTLNPYEHTGDHINCDDPCIELDCDRAGIPGKVVHGLSYFPPHNLPGSSGNDFIPHERLIPAKYNLVIEDPTILKGDGVTLELNVCVLSSALQGNCSNDGGKLKRDGEPDPPQVDICLADEKMAEGGWVVVPPEECNTGGSRERPQHMRATITLSNRSGVTELPTKMKDIWFRSYDSGAEWRVIVTVTDISYQDNGSGGEPEGSWESYEHRGGLPGEYDEYKIDEEYFLPVIGRQLPTDSDKDMAWDVSEMWANGLAFDEEKQQIDFNSDYSVLFFDDENVGHYPDPLNSHTISETMDGLQDDAIDFVNATETNSGFPVHDSKGDRISFWGHQRGFVTKWSPRSEISNERMPSRDWEIAFQRRHENTAVPISKAYGSTKKVFVTFSNNNPRLKYCMPSLRSNDPANTLTISEGLGVIPVEIELENTFPTPGDPLHMTLILDLLEKLGTLDDLDTGALVRLLEKQWLSNCLNFNNGRWATHPFAFDGNGNPINPDPDFVNVIHHLLNYELIADIEYDNEDHSCEAYAWVRHNGLPQLTDFIFKTEQGPIACSAWPIEYSLSLANETFRTINQFETLGPTQAKQLDHAMNVTLHEYVHKIANISGHIHEVLTLADDITWEEITYEKEFNHWNMYGQYYLLTDTEGSTRFQSEYVGHWVLTETYTDVAIESDFYNEDTEVFFLTDMSLDQDFIDHPYMELMFNLIRDHEGDHHKSGQGSSIAEPHRLMVPKCYVEIKPGPNPQYYLPREKRYWLFRPAKFEDDPISFQDPPPLYRFHQTADTDLSSTSFFLEPVSLLAPEHKKASLDHYQKVNLQLIEGPLGPMEIPVDLE